MNPSALRLASLIGVATALLAGCTQMGRESSMREKVTKDADPAFLKRVKNDPFPAAGQAPKVAANTSGAGSNNASRDMTTTTSGTSRPEALADQSNAAAGRSGTIQTAAGPFNPSGGANGAASNRTAITRPNSGLSSNNVRFGAGGNVARNNAAAAPASKSNEIDADAFASDADETNGTAAQTARRGTTPVRRD
jgi:hypothetical protein